VALVFAVAILAGFALAADGTDAGTVPDSMIRITILYDNYAAREGVRTDWGFACLIQGLEKTVLFDTGTNPAILEHNTKLLGVDFAAVDLVVISHLHGDHTGGLPLVLEAKKGFPVYLPGTALARVLEAEKGRISDLGSKPLPATESMEICKDLYLTGSLPGEGGSANDEQALVIDTSGGLVVITGCAHPGVVRIVRRAAEILPKKPTVAMGGFHLMQKSDAEVMAIIADLKSAGVVRCGATHCTGDRQIELFKREFGENYIPMGVGRIIELEK
jgi:7,8-dihydropterin-6-yl-methyl-4-(beta-D-ribofuranosyl)aminobenzene 5'-phosphate synthase